MSVSMRSARKSISTPPRASIVTASASDGLPTCSGVGASGVTRRFLRISALSVTLPSESTFSRLRRLSASEWSVNPLEGNTARFFLELMRPKRSKNESYSADSLAIASWTSSSSAAGSRSRARSARAPSRSDSMARARSGPVLPPPGVKGSTASSVPYQIVSSAATENSNFVGAVGTTEMPAGSATAAISTAPPWSTLSRSRSDTRSPSASAPPLKLTPSVGPMGPLTIDMSPTARPGCSLKYRLMLTVSSKGEVSTHSGSSSPASAMGSGRRRSSRMSLSASVPAWRLNVSAGRRTAPRSSACSARARRVAVEFLSSV